MGLDFITRCTPTFERSWDRSRVQIEGPDLFRRHPEIEGRTFRVTPDCATRFCDGEDLLLRRCGEDLVVYRGRDRLGTVANPPAHLVTAVEQSGGVLCARVQLVHPHSGAADISINP